MPEQTEPSPRRLEVKKYANRRYYDSTHSRHLTLEEIRNLIQQGYDIQVLDARTNADITAQVLTQIILELDTAKLDSLPIPMLVRLIRINDQVMKDFIDKYFSQALRSFLDYQKRLEEQIRESHGLASAFPSVSAWTRAMFEPFAAGFMPHPESGPTPSASNKAAPGTADLQNVVAQLQHEIAELRNTIKKRENQPKHRAPRPRKASRNPPP